MGNALSHWATDLPREQMVIRKAVVTSAVNKFKSDMMGVIGDEGEIDYAEYQRQVVIWNYDLTVAEAAAFNKAIGYTPPIN